MRTPTRAATILAAIAVLASSQAQADVSVPEGMRLFDRLTVPYGPFERVVSKPLVSGDQYVIRASGVVEMDSGNTRYAFDPVFCFGQLNETTQKSEGCGLSPQRYYRLQLDHENCSDCDMDRFAPAGPLQGFPYDGETHTYEGTFGRPTQSGPLYADAYDQVCLDRPGSCTGDFIVDIFAPKPLKLVFGFKAGGKPGQVLPGMKFSRTVGTGVIQFADSAGEHAVSGRLHGVHEDEYRDREQNEELPFKLDKPAIKEDVSYQKDGKRKTLEVPIDITGGGVFCKNANLAMLVITDNPKTVHDEVYLRITNQVGGQTKCSHFHLWNHKKVVVTIKETRPE